MADVKTYTEAKLLSDWVKDARQRTFEIVADLSDEQLMGPLLDIINPLLWEIGHVAWFQEKWVLRHVLNLPPLRKDADALWDSIAIPHDNRWDLPLPSRLETIAYMEAVRDTILETLDKQEPTEELAYFIQYSVFHEDMHTEAFTYTRQTLGYPAPKLSGIEPELFRKKLAVTPNTVKDIEIPGGVFLLGGRPEDPFVFDNEKWAHPVEIKPFVISRTPVTQLEFLAFVEDGGYHRSLFWTPDGWRWRQQTEAQHPVYWKPEGSGQWYFRHFDQWLPLEKDLPVIHVNYYEAEAYCRWANRRLPTEAEWELAAAGIPEEGHPGFSGEKNLFPWGNGTPQPDFVNMDWQAMYCVSVHALPKGDSAFGCRQMLGNVWEWTSSPFLPFPGFTPDPYVEYSQPWFGDRRVLRGGCWATRSRMLRNTWRNFYTPERRDVFGGFRTCAQDI